MRYLSVCSGIEAATVAWHHMGWQPVAFSDIEPFPSAVLAHHYPHVPNLGDMTKFEEWNLESVDLLVGGTPCQSFSVAGLRKGLADPRGNLMLTFLAIAQRQRPRWIVWENVPGVLSSNGGRDFGTFLQALGDLGYGFAYRVLDAQWFGVAQRRRRVFVVGCLGDWQRPAQVLFERESVLRDTAPRREKGQEVAGTFKARANSGGWCQDVDLAAGGYMRCYSGNVEASVAATLETTSHDYSRADGFNVVTQPITFGAKMSVPQADIDLVQTLQATNPMAVAHALTARMYSKSSPDPGAGRGGPVVVAQHPVHYRKSRRAQSTTDHETWVEDDATNTLNCFDVGDVRATDVVAQPVAFDSYNLCETGDITQTIKSPQGGVTESVGAVMTAMQVRRLTPVECERLQGFPDNYTNIPWRKKPESPDGPRYKALGNSMAVPVMRWIGERINKVNT